MTEFQSVRPSDEHCRSAAHATTTVSPVPYTTDIEYLPDQLAWIGERIEWKKAEAFWHRRGENHGRW